VVLLEYFKLHFEFSNQKLKNASLLWVTLYYYYCFKKNYPFCKEKQALFLPNPNDDDAMQRAQHNEDKTLNTHVYSPLQCQDQAALHFLPTIILYSLKTIS